MKNAGQTRVSVWDVGALGVGQTGDNVTQSRKRQVDFRGFFQAVARCAGLVLALGARQVDDVKLADLDVSLAVFVDLRALNSDGED